MKNILILLFFAQIASAQTDTITLKVNSGSITTVPTLSIFGPSTSFDCEPYEKFTDWVVTNIGDFENKLHSHKWVYADIYDINKSSGITNAVYCPCGCGNSENEARICQTCLRHETRVRHWGFTQTTKKESKYMQIKNRLKK